MTKEILDLVTVTKCEIVKVYGVAMGVGYDLDVFVEFDKGFQYFPAHAGRQSWAMPEHLRPDNPYYKYTGSNDVYQGLVKGYWADKNSGLKELLSRLPKDELEEYYHTIVGA